MSIDEVNGSILEMSISIDPEHPTAFRAALPYGLVLGASTMDDSVAAVNTALLEAMRANGFGGDMSSPDFRPAKPAKSIWSAENMTFGDWVHICPDSGEGSIAMQVSSRVTPARSRVRFGPRPIDSCVVRPSGS